MNRSHAVIALGALAQEARLEIFRLLLEAGPDGLGAGQIAGRMDIPSSTLSSHLTHLKQAGLVTAETNGSSLPTYMADFKVMTGIVSYLTEACCRRNPGICGITISEPAAVPRRERPTPEKTRAVPVDAIQQRPFHYRDHGVVTAFRVRVTPAYGLRAITEGSVTVAEPVHAIHLQAEWGQTVVLSPGNQPLESLSDADLVAVCDKAGFLPAVARP